LKHVQKYGRQTPVIFPFDEEFYRTHGVAAEYVGHPLADVPLPTITRDQFARENGLDPAKTWVALLPDNRSKEVELNLATMLLAATHVRSTKDEFVLPVASSLEFQWVKSLVEQGPVPVTPVHDARAALLHARAGIVASGTATIEAALIGTPFVMIYRVAPMTYAMGRRFVKLTRFAMVNLIAGRDVVPEYVQQGFIPEEVGDKVGDLIADGPLRETMSKGLAEVSAKLHTPGEKTAADRAAGAILATLAR
jgi:lipid-A-disaccharide synthase